MKKIKSNMLKTAAFIAAIILLLCSLTTAAYASESEISSIDEYVLRPSAAGSLHVDGTSLYGENNQEVVLQGVSLHGLTWYPQYVNNELFSYVSENWNANLIRLPMYSDIYCNGKQSESLNLVEKGVEYAVNSDMYVLVDWHILDDNNPNQNLAGAIEFFKTVSVKYADYSNVLYEICNEPNGDTTWKDVQDYANIIIPIIRENDPDAVIIVGTPNYDRNLEDAVSDPLEFDNIMYSFHFYASSHGQDMRDTLTSALDAGLPVFITECGLSEDTGDGNIDFDETKSWFSLLHERHLSYSIWSLSNKEESSAMIKYTSFTTGKLSDSDLTDCGLWVRALLKGENVDDVKLSSTNGVSLYQTLRTNKGLTWGIFAGSTFIFLLLVAVITIRINKRFRKQKCSYDELLKLTGGNAEKTETADEIKKRKLNVFGRIALLITTFLTFIYLIWRIVFSVPVNYGVIAIICNIVLLIVEIQGFAESLIHYYGLLHNFKHPLPQIRPDEYPDVDIFVSTYNEPTSLLRKTLIGCKHIEYPDKNKVHIYLCDDHRRPQMRELAQELGVNYFDRPDNEGAKAGNLNHALGLTSSPYVVTFDADMIPRREFLMKTMPYFVDAEKRNAKLKNVKMPLGFIQTPQSFYNPDIFQYSLYEERNIPNEQDFFYRTIESAKTYSNSVIYGGSNTIISRKALEDIGGFYTKTITEDFATGMLIESSGYVSLGLSEPLASGLAPTSFKEHVQQRTRWGRGVILTGRQLRFLLNKNLTIEQKMSYWSSVVYWYSPIKNLIYLLAPLMYGLIGIPVFKCTWVDILIFWLPMFIFQNVTLISISSGTMSSKWSGIQETSVMPFLLVPIVKESLGISLSTFKVTNKDGKFVQRKTDYRMMIPFFVLIGMSVAAIVIRAVGLINGGEFGLVVILFWLIRNVYFLVMDLFLVDGRDNDGENVHVYADEKVIVNGKHNGIAKHMTEHSIDISLPDTEPLKIGTFADIKISDDFYKMDVKGVVVFVRRSRKENVPDLYTFEIVKFGEDKDTYIQMLYDRIPTLPQHYYKEHGILRNLWRNVAKRIAGNKF